LKLADVSRGDVIAPHLDGGFDLRIEFDDLRFEALSILGEEFFGRHHLCDRVVQLGHAVTHVADRLLKDAFGVFRLFDDATEHRAQ
jgi:hypothetical protein